MPKYLEITIEISIQRVTCPGVWLCQDGRVSLTVFALGTSYQTCLLPPMFPLLFKDVFYFRKRFQESCALNNICCLLKDETIFCELVQWCENCNTGECIILAQYLGALNDVLFPPNMCSNEGVDLLMRRSKDFPGILSPKIEIATKVRIDEVWNGGNTVPHMKATSCHCSQNELEAARQRQVCHTPLYHRNKCNSSVRQPPSAPRSRSRSRSGGSRSWCSLKDRNVSVTCKCPNPPPPCRLERRPRSASRAFSCRRQYRGNVAKGDVADGSCKRNAQTSIDDEAIPFSPCSASPRSASPRSASPRSASPRSACFRVAPHRPRSETRSRPPRRAASRPYEVYSVDTGDVSDAAWARAARRSMQRDSVDLNHATRSSEAIIDSPVENRLQKILLESRYIEEEINERVIPRDKYKKFFKPQISPCVCEICKRYHQLFHVEHSKS